VLAAVEDSGLELEQIRKHLGLAEMVKRKWHDLYGPTLEIMVLIHGLSSK
jgi:hypothetical protein